MRNFAFVMWKNMPLQNNNLKFIIKEIFKTSASNIKKQDIQNLIDIVLSDLEKNRFINDKFYSESKAKSMIQKRELNK